MFPRTRSYAKCIVKNTFLEVDVGPSSLERASGTPRGRSVPTSFRSPRKCDERAALADASSPMSNKSENCSPVQTLEEFVDDDEPEQAQEPDPSTDGAANVVVRPAETGSEFRPRNGKPKRSLGSLFAKTSDHIKCVVKNTFLEVSLAALELEAQSSAAVRGRSWPRSKIGGSAVARQSSRTKTAEVPPEPRAELNGPPIELVGPIQTVEDFLNEDLVESAADKIGEVVGGQMPSEQPTTNAMLQEHAAVSVAQKGNAEADEHSIGRSKQSTKQSAKPLPHGAKYLVGIESDDDFNVVRRLIGPAAENTKSIMKASKGSKLHIRGRGSKRSDGDTGEDPEAEGPLCIVLRAPSARKLELAAELVEALLRDVHQQYHAFCQANGRASPELAVARLPSSWN